MRQDEPDKDSSSSVTVPKECAVCAATGDGGQLLRCTQCKSRHYCSRTCQEKDWKRHKKACRYVAQQDKAVQAWKELEQIVQNTSRADAAQAFQRAKDEMATLQVEDGQQEPNPESDNTSNLQQDPSTQGKAVNVRERSTRRATQHEDSSPVPVDATRSSSTSTSKMTASGQSREIEKPNLTPSLSSPLVASKMTLPECDPQAVEQTAEALARSSATGMNEFKSEMRKEDSCFDFYIEQFPHLSCYQLDLRPKSAVEGKAVELQHWSIHISTDDSKDVSTISLYNALCQHNFSFCIPGCMKDSLDSVSVSNGRLSIRLSYEAISEPFVYSKSTSIEAANQISCLSCGSLLLCDENAPRIQRVAPLPTGLWDEMGDYLVCFEGQPSIDFTSSSTEAQRGLVLEDSTVLVYHFDDIAPNLQVLAIPGYGEGEGEEGKEAG